MNFWGKRIKNTNEISKETGIDEKKIKELKEGKREITGEAMNKVLDAINKIEKKTDMEKKVEKEEVMNWYKNNDLNKLMKKFGYKRQKDCAKEIGIAQSSLNALINRKPQHYTKVTQKVYDFFNDEFNKKVDNEKQEGEIIIKAEPLNKEKKFKVGNYTIESYGNGVAWFGAEKEQRVDPKVEEINYERLYKEQQEEISKLTKQIERYEKLIDRLGE